jgi:prefoldin subunit 2
MASSTAGKSDATAKKAVAKKSPEEAIAGFNGLRNEQRAIATKLYELDCDLNEHKVVVENLKNIDEGRKCFRMIGGILVEGTVKDVLPNLQVNIEQLTQTIEALNQKLIEKGKEIVEYKEKNNIHFQVPERIPEEEESSSKAETPRNVGVLAT